MGWRLVRRAQEVMGGVLPNAWGHKVNLGKSGGMRIFVLDTFSKGGQDSGNRHICRAWLLRIWVMKSYQSAFCGFGGGRE